MLPDYYDGELLPAGTHECEWEEFFRRFGIGGKRSPMAERLRGMLDTARQCAFRKAVIFGSFVTARNDPGDIDILWLTTPDLNRDELALVCQELLDSARSRDKYECDVFYCPENSEMLGILMGTFGIDKKTQKPRGAVILDLST